MVCDCVRFGLRMLARQRLFTIVSASVLALSIGANTAIFSLLDATLLRSLPYRDPDRLVVLWAQEDDRPAAFSIRAL